MSNRVGIIVGRFQNAFVHEGQQNLINFVLENNDKIVIFIGKSEVINTKKNPLPSNIVKQMVETYMKGITEKEFYIHFINDLNDDNLWSKLLDDMISSLINKSSDITLYGSRDSFLEVYCGKHKTHYFEPKITLCNTSLREKITIEDNQSFRNGLIYASQIKYPTVYATVDIVQYFLLREKIHFVFGRKNNSNRYCLSGGFSDPLYDKSFKGAALRELKEECNISVHENNLHYFDSRLINDFRYKKETDKIITSIFTIHLSNDQIKELKAGDDLKELIFISEDELDNFDIFSDHRLIINDFLKILKNKQSETSTKIVTIILNTDQRIENVLIYDNQLYVPVGIKNDEIKQILF
jgi:bifunctional NMN adenylyltransferase/nudix hydrolase